MLFLVALNNGEQGVMQTYTITKPFLELQCDLAEGPYWEEQENVLRFVDIVKQSVYRIHLDHNPPSVARQDYDVSMGVTADIKSTKDSFVFGGKHGVGIAKKTNSQYQYIDRFWTEQEVVAGKELCMRANDGSIDSHGRFWVGVLNDPLVEGPAPVGMLVKYDSKGGMERVIENITIPNGISWTEDDTKMYFTDSATKNIFVYDYDPIGGQIENRRLFFRVEDDTGVPDGHAQDVQGSLWVAIWGAWKVVRISPDGVVTAQILLPTRCITSVAFVGEDLFITSASEEEPERYPDSLKYQGAIFKCHVGVRGRPTNKADL